MQVTQSIQKFLEAQQPKVQNADFIARYNPAMEVQINVAGPGEPVDGRQNTWDDGEFSYHHIRIPRNAMHEPEFKDYPIKFPLELYAEAIGMTGWDWKNRTSRWVGFDFDAITGHAPGVGVSGAQLQAIRDKVSAIPWVETRKSTRGAGLHLYVYLDVPTKNHTEHAALGRCVLGLMSSEAGFDFASQVDSCGGNQWCWHRNASHDGYALLKTADQPLENIPPNWKDHIEVVTKRRGKVRIHAVAERDQDPFESLTSSRTVIPLDERHREIMDLLCDSGFSTIWVPDHHLLQTHTAALAKVHADEGLDGFFKTNSGGGDPGTPNCFLFPLAHGAWRVYRFSPGVQEAETWDQDGSSWTSCYFNRHPDLDTAARALGGVERQNNSGYVFQCPTEAARVIAALGHEVEMPDIARRETVIKKNKDGRLVIEIKKVEGDAVTGWESKKGIWSKVLNVRADVRDDENIGATGYDDTLRSLVTPTNDDAGWVVRENNGRWRRTSKDNVKNALLHLGHTKNEAELILGGAVLNSWRLVNLPFQPEYPGDRAWNHQAAQFRFQPSDTDSPTHPHWDAILSHIGQSLTSTLRRQEWAQKAGIKTGADYLMQWIAAMLRFPFEPLPYLFLFSIPQNTGKSILHEAIGLLMTHGVASADRALTNSSDFNGELANAVLAYIDEKDVSQAGESAYNKVKDWVTSRTLWVRKMRTDAYPQPNTLHFIQTANKLEACPVFPGDTRITFIHVPELENEIPKSILMERLESEAPDFMRSIMDVELAQPTGRLRIPVVDTLFKKRAEEFSKCPVESFIEDCLVYSPGERVKLSDLHARFLDWLPGEERVNWQNSRKLSHRLPQTMPVSRGSGNKTYVGNVIFGETDGASD